MKYLLLLGLLCGCEEIQDKPFQARPCETYFHRLDRGESYECVKDFGKVVYKPVLVNSEVIKCKCI